MAKIYYNMIIRSNGSKTIDDVPLRWRDAVSKLLSENSASESET